MRTTLHIVPSEELPRFHQVDAKRRRSAELQNAENLLVLADVCEQEQARTALKKLHCRVLAVLAERGPSTVQEISQAVPELQAKIRHSVGKAYEGEFSPTR
jgi:flagellar biosynthesis regulator FlbT